MVRINAPVDVIHNKTPALETQQPGESQKAHVHLFSISDPLAVKDSVCCKMLASEPVSTYQVGGVLGV